MLLLIVSNAPAFAVASRVRDVFPSPDLTAEQVIETHLQALQAGDNRRIYRFCSPENKRLLGVPHFEDERVWRQPPEYETLPTYRPLVRCARFAILGALPLDAGLSALSRELFRVRCWPTASGRASLGGMSFALAGRPVEFDFLLARQPFTRPACYEDDPMQGGWSAEPPGAGCWMVHHVTRLDDRDFGSEDEDGGDGDGGPGIALKVSATAAIAPYREQPVVSAV
mmetsp:Transcript_286/g.949  ORF Transcript_286/g.949 Transcript_286/m.949 type:complete len:226 (+) Transcript_286:151-828(+)